MSPVNPSWALADGNTAQIVIACLILIGIVVAAAAAVMLFKRWLRSGIDVPTAGFTLIDLREMHRNGKITTEEYERTKAMIVQAAKRPPEPANPKSVP